MVTKRKFSIRTTILVIVLLIAVAMTVIIAVDDTVASARVTQTQINRLRAEKKEYERKKQDIQAKIDAIEFEHMAVLAQKDILDERIELTSFEIKNINETIDQYLLLIREKEYETFLAQSREANQLDRYKARVRYMEENGILSYLEIIFDSTSFSDFLARVDFVRDILYADQRMYENLQAAKIETVEAKVALEEVKEEMDEEKEQLEIKETELNAQLEEAHELIRKLEADIENESQLRDQIIADEERVQTEINRAVARLRAQQEAERIRRQNAQRQSQTGSAGSGDSNSTDGGSASESGSSGGGGGGSVSGTGALMWPLNGSIWSEFGPRSGRLHGGIDIGAPRGTNVVAADSGTVITSTSGGSYGNYVVISHGNGITTLYAHLSSRSVKVGDTVSKGQVVGQVGSTGNATGAHLHFEVSVNGSRVDPRTKL